MPCSFRSTGAKVPTDRKRDRGWHEGKVGVCARVSPESARLVPGEDAVVEYGPAEFCIGCKAQAAFWPRRYAHALATGRKDPSCQQLVLIGDGAHGIWEDGATHLRSPGREWTEMLDFYHASQHLWDVAGAVWPRDSAAAFVWAEDARHRLRHAGGEVLPSRWDGLPPLPAATQEIVDKETAYFRYHADRLDYPRYRARGLPIRSGRVKSAGKNVLKQRESGSGMRWREVGAQAIATLYAIHRSGRWDALWDRNPCAASVPLKRRIAA